MVEDRVDHFLVALNDLEDAIGQARLLHQFGKAHRHAGVALAGLQNEGVAAGDGDAEHPHRDHRGEVERGDARDDAERLTHRIDVDSGPGPLSVLALEHMRDAAGEFDDFKPALNIALRIRDHLAMFGAEQMGEFVHMLFDQRLKREHDARTPLWVGRGPCGLGCQRLRHRGV